MEISYRWEDSVPQFARASRYPTDKIQFSPAGNGGDTLPEVAHLTFETAVEASEYVKILERDKRNQRLILMDIST